MEKVVFSIALNQRDSALEVLEPSIQKLERWWRKQLKLIRWQIQKLKRWWRKQLKLIREQIQKIGREYFGYGADPSTLGSGVLKIAEFICTKEYYEWVVRKIGDMRQEYGDALNSGRKAKAWFVLIRSYLALVWDIVGPLIEFILRIIIKVSLEDIILHHPAPAQA